ncbi:MAG: DUF4386 domain-containing protein [Woeseiaceae bacterium]|nr:DUF4386 domain-containing protein [Woeseiaceae bacterium]
MDNSIDRTVDGRLSLRSAALIAGFGLLIMAICAPLAFFQLLPQGIVRGDGAATVERLRTNGTPYLLGTYLLFLTYVMDVVVAWALYWLLRPGQKALSLLVAWMRIVYTALAFMGLMAYFHAYDLANATDFAMLADATGLQAEILYQLFAAQTTTSVALTFFGVHLLVMGVVIWRSTHIPRWTGIAVALAGAAYVILYGAQYFAPDLSLDWLMLFALGELIFMGWMLISGWRLEETV